MQNLRINQKNLDYGVCMKEKSMEKRAPKSSRISKLVTIGNLKLDLLININLIKELVERARADT